MSNNLSTSEIYNNAAALQMLLHALCKSVSNTDEEFNLKYDVYERLMRTYNRWGYGTQMTTFGSLTYYCLKANGAKSKLTLGFLYIYWINHFFTVGSFIGVTFSLPWAMRHLQKADLQSSLYQQLTQIQNLIRNRKDESDSELNNMFYALRVINNEVKFIINNIFQQKLQDQKRTQLVENDFFDTFRINRIINNQQQLYQQILILIIIINQKKNLLQTSRICITYLKLQTYNFYTFQKIIINCSIVLPIYHLIIQQLNYLLISIQKVTLLLIYDTYIKMTKQFEIIKKLNLYLLNYTISYVGKCQTSLFRLFLSTIWVFYIHKMDYKSWLICRVYTMIILLYITLILTINAKKKFDPLSVRPRTFDKHIYCMGCQAIIRETLKEIKQSKSEIFIEDSLSTVCDKEFIGYAYISRTVQSGCNVFIGGWRDKLTEYLMERESNETIEDQFCVQYTKACFEINPLEVELI